jgi:glycosyltransferase involved in cell wall biosynthesis
MLHGPLTRVRRVLMTLDAVGGVWRYAVDLARSLDALGIETLLVGFGPPPSAAERAEVEAIDGASLCWVDGPLDWMCASAADYGDPGATLAALAGEWDVDLLHLNLPSQAATLPREWPALVVSHSCLATWWSTVRGDALPQSLRWQVDLTQRGFDRGDAVVAPSRSHAEAIRRCYGGLAAIAVIENGAAIVAETVPKEPFVLAAGRWWDEGKNASTLDASALGSPWPVLMAGPLRGPNGQSVRLGNAKECGTLPTAELHRLMARASIFASPSLYEPFGLAVLEAAAQGCALVLADIPTFRELWRDAALFAGPRGSIEFTACIARLTADPGLRERLSEAARRRAAQFTLSRQAQAFAELYGSLPSRNRSQLLSGVS